MAINYYRTLLSRAMLFMLAVAGMLAGCSETYRVSFEMPTHSVASLRATGDTPLLRVENDGPGTITITDRVAGPAQLMPGAFGRTIQPDETVRLESGDQSAQIRIIIERATGMELNGPLPKEAWPTNGERRIAPPSGGEGTVVNSE